MICPVKAPPGAVVAGPTGQCCSTMTARRWVIEVNNRAGDSEFAIGVGSFFANKKIAMPN